jgi:hypothetical protein
MDRSSRRSRGHAAAAATGYRRPTATSAVRTPAASTTSAATITPCPHRQGDRTLQDAEHPRQHVVGGGPAPQREASDVDQRVAHADAGQQDQRRGLGRDGADERHRQPAQGHAQGEPGVQGARADQQGRGGGAQHGARPDGGVQRADARLTGPREVDGDDDGEHRRRSPGERLRRREADDEREVTCGSAGQSRSKGAA